MKKKIAQVAQIPDAKFDALKELFQAHAESRTTGGGGLMKWVQESVPDVGQAGDVYDKVLNVITASRDAWTMRQKEILNMQAQHDGYFEVYPRAWVLAFCGREKLPRVQIVTSTATAEAFESGVDDDVTLDL